MRLLACLSRTGLALLLALSPMHWVDARLCDRAPAAQHKHEAGGAGAAMPAKADAPARSPDCCCGGGACGAGCLGSCVQVLSALSAHPPVFIPWGHMFGDRPPTPVYEFTAPPPTPPPQRA